MSLFITIHGLLLIYSYRFQPCIGSGLFVNNIRVLVFSSSTYVGLATLLELLCAVTHKNDALLLLLPLPLVWISAWCINSKRAVKFHVPRASISNLLISNPYRVRVVGAIAALHLNATQVTSEEASRIILHLSQRLEDKKEESLVRIYVARTLWHLRFREFAATGKVLLDKTHSPESKVLRGDEWQPDEDQDNSRIKSLTQFPLRNRHEACNKIRRSSVEVPVEFSSCPEAVRKKSQVLPAPKRTMRHTFSEATASVKKIAKRIVAGTVVDGLRDPLQGEQVVNANQNLIDTVLDLMYSATEANVQAAKLVLDLFRADHIQLSSETCVLMTCCLCSDREENGVYNLSRFLVLSESFWSTLLGHHVHFMRLNLSIIHYSA